MIPANSTPEKRGPSPVLFLLLCTASAAPLSAQTTKFQADQHRLYQEAEAVRKAKGLRDIDALLEKYPPAAFQPVTIQKVAPGGSAAIALTGTIPAGVTILSEKDGAVLSGATVSGTSYSARMTVAANEGPGFVRLFAFTPVSGGVARVSTAFVDTIYRFELQGPNGLTVRIVPTEKTFTIADNRNASLKYQADFYRPGETRPFGTRVGPMSYGADDEPRTRLDISLREPDTAWKKELEEIGNRLQDPKLTDAQRDALMERMMKAQQRMMEDMMKLQKDPASAQKKVDEFGCRLVQVYPGQAGAGKATILCGKNFHGGTIRATATMTIVR
ncbi:MAG TPA: hypothetical protein VH881_16785 [Burkholderiales bacterium]|jgi:hypothetical protein